ncbi:GNAT family N-acetyltransferase [Paenibacillus spiritus]|uniref:GNAT family N-acetyltransferase n=1 Tax=Paenibacillus spiritus TaxID=2496557 RepID=A0A5J5G917_9BACL|nr:MULTISPECIES: GNAT family N-acetyltransferase [Paenibacillus]KAA9004091.1 GNAT family N-acetyltransferase [Paenibacillus spiritus]
MLVDLIPRLEEPVIPELLGYAVAGEPELLRQAGLDYAGSDDLRLAGWEEDGVVVGLVGYEETEDGSLVIRHIAVLPENRGRGYARGMLLELMLERNPRFVLAETGDELAADFYRRLGFMVYSLGVNPAGVEQFRCVYEVEEAQDED